MEFQRWIEPQQDPSQIAAGIFLISIPIILVVGARLALKAAAAKEHAMSHQVENVEIEERPNSDGSGAHRLPVEESLKRFVIGLRHSTEPFEKMGARFDPKHHEQELHHLASLKKRLEADPKPASEQAKAYIVEADQILARYAPN